MKVAVVLIATIIASAYSGSIARIPRQVDTVIELDAALAAAGSGWAAENHADDVSVTGAGGWGPNAELVISSSGESVVAQDGTIIQVTSNDGADNAAALNLVSVDQIAEVSEGQLLNASGLEISNEQSGSAVAAGEGASAADATTLLTVSGIPAPSGWGMANPQ